MSTWPSEGRQEKERDEEVADVKVRLLTADGPETQTEFIYRGQEVKLLVINGHMEETDHLCMKYS